MDEVWERAVETALEGQTDSTSARTLTLDGAVKCFQGRLPPPSTLEKFQNLEHLSIANVGVSSLEKFPCLPNLEKLILSDNRIAGGLEFLVEAGLESLRDLDLSNNRIQYIEDLAPLAQLKLVSLDLYECPVTRSKDYRSRVFGLIRSLKYLDKMDADENERPESDEEEDEDEEEEEDDDPGSGEIDGEYRLGKMGNGGSAGSEGVLDVDEDEESDADEEADIARVADGFNGSSHQSNGFHVAASRDGGDMDADDVEDEDDVDDLGEEIDEEDGDDEDVVEVHEIEDSDDEEDGVEEDDDDDDDNEEEDVEDEDVEPGSTGRLTSTEGEIDGHAHEEEDENGEIGEEHELEMEEDESSEENDGEDEDEDYGTEFLIQPIVQADEDAEGSDFDPGDEADDIEEEEEVEDEEIQHGEFQAQPSTSSQPKRKRDDDDEDDSVVEVKSSKHH